MIQNLLPFVLGAYLALWLPVALVYSAGKAGQTTKAGKPAGARDRLVLAGAFSRALLGVLLSWLFVPWGVVPPMLWAIPVALTACGTFLAAGAWLRLPWVAPGRRAWLAATNSAIGVAFAGTVAWLILA